MSKMFKAVAQGFHGPITVTSEIDNGKIKDISAEGIQPDTVGTLSAKRMVEKIKEEKSVNIDAVTGATFSSSAVLKAAKKSMELAEGKITAAEANDLKQEPIDKVTVPTYAKVHTNRIYASDVKFVDEYDVIIAGSGVTGLSAAIESARNGAKTVLFEKAGMIGGTSNFSHGIIQAAGTKQQKEHTKYQKDDSQKHAREYLQAGEGHVDEELVRDFTDDAANTIAWLSEIGINWVDVYGHKSIPYENQKDFADRIHVYDHGGHNGAGVIMTSKMLNAAKDAGVIIKYDSPVVGLVTKNLHDNEILGVVVNHHGQEKAYRALKGTVLATASIDHNEQLAKELSPWQYRDIKKNVLLTSKYDTGDGIILGMTNGAALNGIGGVMSADFKFGIGFSTQVITPPAFYINGLGKRYVNEDSTYGYLTRANYEQETSLGKPTWLVFGQNTVDEKNLPYETEEEIQKDISRGRLIKAATAEELAQKIEVSDQNLTDTLTIWNQNAKEKKDPAFGRRQGIEPLETPLYAYKNHDMNIGSIGGLKVNVNLQVIDNGHQPIEGLYAAGQNAGGIIGSYYAGSGTALGVGLHQGRKVGRQLALKK
ncbi:FAD-dependent oxidoreductase [Pediococcus stilesii]|uniref:Urocanate reductase n=1 Tax=Pediococcus stilesii TaxID=331679 RepID=A0A0R2KUI8_9LACO|nr:FAD-dependent oxidoreductase [Pediococcus stilesii]KRN93153.1 flavoprotein [Pediococcus stilesii]